MSATKGLRMICRRAFRAQVKSGFASFCGSPASFLGGRGCNVFREVLGGGNRLVLGEILHLVDSVVHRFLDIDRGLFAGGFLVALGSQDGSSRNGGNAWSGKNEHGDTCCGDDSASHHLPNALGTVFRGNFHRFYILALQNFGLIDLGLLRLIV